MGTTADAHTLRLLDEIRVLRSRVAELEDALATAEAVAEPADEDAEAVLVDVDTAVLEGSASR